MKARGDTNPAETTSSTAPPSDAVPLPAREKPVWIRTRAYSHASHYAAVSALLREKGLVTVCEKAACPNKGECFGRGTATFMIMGKQCTRHCPFCNVQHGIPDKPDESEPERLAEAVVLLRLAHVVITSVTRDDLPDGGAEHYARCIRQIRAQSPKTGVEVLTPDFRHCAPDAIRILGSALPDVMNHNVETVPRLYPAVRPQASYTHTLSFLRQFRETYPAVPTKSGLMVGLGERDEEIIAVMRDLHANGVSMLTIGQYLSPSPHHLPVARYVPPETFSLLERIAHDIGFSRVTAGPLVRSSYHADTQACRSDEEETGTKAPHPSATTLSP